MLPLSTTLDTPVASGAMSGLRFAFVPALLLWGIVIQSIQLLLICCHVR